MEQLAVKMQRITKIFGGVKANDAVDFSLRQGSIHGLLGENGAGKTTLMNILYGLYQQEEGTIEIHGKQEDISSPIKAISLGIGMVHQHFMLARPLSVVENVMLGKKSRRGILLDTRETAQELRALSDRYHMEIDPYSKIWQLSVGEQQRVEILSAIYLGAQILILDEPTAVLTPQETELFFDTLRQMRKDGKSIILITHKLEEIISIVDEVTVLRGGKCVGSKLVDESVTKDELTRMMVGRDVLFDFPPVVKAPGGVRMRLEALSARNDKGVEALKEFSLELHAGEIVGLAGVDGNGQKELCEVLTGNIDFACDYIEKHFEGVTVSKPQGTYMLFVDCTDWCKAHGKTIEDVEHACWDVGAAIQDGTMFFGPCHLRMNLASPRSRIEEAFHRMDKYVFNA